MQNRNRRYTTLILALLFMAGSVFAMPAPLIMPKAQAAHFCRLLINDGESIAPLSSHAHRLMAANDSLTSEQIFASYIFRQSNWITLRVFPHTETDGTVAWYSASDLLPASVSTEHQKYIREVFPHLQAEIEAGHWTTVDAYIDKMIEYQCKFANNDQAVSTPSYLIYVVALFFAVLLISRIIFVNLHPKRTKQ